jgi:glucokinase
MHKRQTNRPFIAGALGIDIGGTKTAAAFVRPDGVVGHRHVVPTPARAGASAVLAAAISAGRQALASAEAAGLKIRAVGVGTAGHVDRRRGAISYASELLPGWTGVELGREIGDAFGLPVAVENDVNAMALGEKRFGAGRPFDHALFITVGTGIGGAMISNGRLWNGATWTAGEIGHLVVDWDGTRRCACGRTGHLEAYASGPAMAEQYKLVAGRHGPVDLVMVAGRARDGDPLAAETLAEGARILGLALGGLLNALDPQALIVGGGVAELHDLWWPALEAALRSNPMPGPARIALRRAALGVDAVLIGAASLALSEHAPELWQA